MGRSYEKLLLVLMLARTLLHSSDVLAPFQVLGCEADLSTLREYHQVRCQTVHLLPPNT